MTNPEELFERGPDAVSFDAADERRIRHEIERIGAKTVLEFGPGAIKSV